MGSELEVESVALCVSLNDDHIGIRTILIPGPLGVFSVLQQDIEQLDWKDSLEAFHE